MSDGFDSRGLPYTEVTLKVSRSHQHSKMAPTRSGSSVSTSPPAPPTVAGYLGRPTGWPTWRGANRRSCSCIRSRARPGFQTHGRPPARGKLSLANGKAMNAVRQFAAVRRRQGQGRTCSMRRNARCSRPRGPGHAAQIPAPRGRGKLGQEWGIRNGSADNRKVRAVPAAVPSRPRGVWPRPPSPGGPLYLVPVGDHMEPAHWSGTVQVYRPAAT